MTIMNVLSLFGGLGLFLFGMQLMGEALEKAAGTRLKKLLGMVTGNRFLAMLAGITITAVVQSSSATTVMVVGFVNAGLMSLTQAVGVIMGANIGTTVTSLLLSVQIDFAAIFTFLGLILSNLPDKYRTAKQFGTITMGLGILFIGMNTMSGAMEPLRTWEGFQTAMASINNPILGVLIGAGITAVLQSSAASIGFTGRDIHRYRHSSLTWSSSVVSRSSGFVRLYIISGTVRMKALHVSKTYIRAYPCASNCSL